MTQTPAPLSDNTRSLTRMTMGKDEINLAEFPFALLRSRGDRRTSITHNVDVYENGIVGHQRWVVSGSTEYGLPQAFDEGVWVALMAISADQGFRSMRVSFSCYEILRIIYAADGRRVPAGGREYERIEKALQRLTGVTFYSDGAFFDEETQQRVKDSKAFSLISEFALRSNEEEGMGGYIIWAPRIWKNIRAGYTKDLDTCFFFGLRRPNSRRLYRLLDLRMAVVDECEIPVSDLSGRMGMAEYRKAADVRSKLQPAFDELIERGFLTSAELIPGRGARFRFVRQERAEGATLADGGGPDLAAGAVEQLVAYGITEKKAKNLAGRFQPEYIEAKIALLEYRLTHPGRGRPITTSAGWLIRAIETDFSVPEAALEWWQGRQQGQAGREYLKNEIEAQIAAEAEAQQVAHQSRVQEGLGQLEQHYGTTVADRDLWEQVLRHLERTTLKNTFKLWLADTRLLSWRDGLAVVAVRDKIARNWIESRFADLLPEAITEVTGESAQIAFETIKAVQAPDPSSDEGVQGSP